MSWFQRWLNAFHEETQVARTAGWVQLATAEGKNMFPTVRTIVNRGHSELNPSAAFYFCTDVRSKKITNRPFVDTLKQPAEAIWLFRSQGLQWRLRGDLYCVPRPDNPLFSLTEFPTNERNKWLEIRKSVYDGLDLKNRYLRASFSRNAPTPGTKFDKELSLSVPSSSDLEDDYYFGLLVLVPHHVDTVKFHSTSNQRWNWVLDRDSNGFHETEVFP